MKINNEDTIGIDVNIGKPTNNSQTVAKEDIDINLDDDFIQSNMPQAEQLEIIDDTPLTTINIPQETTPINDNSNNQNQNFNQNQQNNNQNIHQHNNQCNHHQHNHGENNHQHNVHMENLYNFNYHGPNCQCQQHKMSKFQILKYKILYYCYMIDGMIEGIFNRIIIPIEQTFYSLILPEFIVRICSPRHILFWIFIYFSNYLLSKSKSNELIDNIIKYNSYSIILSIFIFYVDYFLIKKNLYYQQDKQLENYCLNRNPQIKVNQCQKCKSIASMRTFHCMNCDKCVIKFQTHSLWFNICIGAANELFYSITLITIFLNFSITLIIFIYISNFYSDSLLYYKLSFNIWIFVILYMNIKHISYTYDFFKNILFENLTYVENENTRLTYLLKDYRQFYNPFKKSFFKTILEIIVNAFNIDIYKMKELEKENYIPIEESPNEKIDLDNPIMSPEEELKSYRLMLKLREPFKPFVSKEGHIHMRIDGTSVTNWNILRIFSVLELSNSPFNDLIYSQAEYGIKNAEKNQNKTTN